MPSLDSAREMKISGRCLREAMSHAQAVSCRRFRKLAYENDCMTQTAYGERRDSEGPQDPNCRHGELYG